MLTPLMRSAVKHYNFAYSIFPRFILTWDYKTGRLSQTNTFRKLLLWYLFLIVIFFGGFCYPLYFSIKGLSGTLSNPREKIILMLFISFASASVTHWGMGIVFVLWGREFAVGTNNVMSLHYSLVKRTSVVRSILLLQILIGFNI